MPGAAPLIGVSVGRFPAAPRVTEGADREYSRAVRVAGGLPVLVPPVGAQEATVSDPAGAAEAVVSRLDGIVLSGGGDVDPASYCRERSPRVGGVDPDRDATEIALVRAAVAAGLPLLGICRGCQVLNVALGGTLHQHLPDVTALDHLQPEPRNRLVHPVAVEPASRLEAVVGRPEVEVNSIHHQAVDRPASSLRVTAWAPDGVIEALEHPDRPVIGVQWHPESLVPSGPHLALFAWLVAQAAPVGARA